MKLILSVFTSLIACSAFASDNPVVRVCGEVRTEAATKDTVKQIKWDNKIFKIVQETGAEIVVYHNSNLKVQKTVMVDLREGAQVCIVGAIGQNQIFPFSIAD